MMPLSLAAACEEYVVLRVGGMADTKKHLEDLGFTPGSTVKVISELNGNLIVQSRESRIAISKEMAQKIMV